MKTKEETLTDIAANTLGFETLKVRNSDSLDFKDVSVWQAKEGLEAAYEAGKTQEKTLSTNNNRFTVNALKKAQAAKDWVEVARVIAILSGVPFTG